MAALLAVDSAITGEAPPAALRTAPGDVDADGQIEVLVEVRRLVDGQAGMAAGDRRRMLVVAGCTAILGAAHRPDAMIFDAVLARSLFTINPERPAGAAAGTFTADYVRQ